MKSVRNRFTHVFFTLLAMLAGMVLFSGCTRYARNVDTLYEATTFIHGGSGELYIVIPPSQQTQSPDIKWVLGKVKDDENKQIDEVSSPRSPAEIIQTALSTEFRKAGYAVITATQRPTGGQAVIDLTRSEINLEQISDLADIKVTCRVLAGMDIVKNGQLIKRLQYEATSSKTDIKDRDLLARSVLNDTLQSIMQKAVPELSKLLGT